MSSPGLPVTVFVSGGADMQPAPAHERPDIETDTLREAFQVRDFPRFRYLEELRLQTRTGPAILLELSLDVSGTY